MIKQALENMDCEFYEEEHDGRTILIAEAVTLIDEKTVHVKIGFEPEYYEERPEAVRAALLWFAVDEYYDKTQNSRRVGTGGGSYHSVWGDLLHSRVRALF